MTSGEYIEDRWMPKIIKELCEENFVSIRSYSDDWILTLEKGSTKKVIYGYKFGGFNDSVASAVTLDKVATHELLAEAGMPSVPHVLLSTKLGLHDSSIQLASTWKRIVVKPIHGGGGRGVYALNNVDEALKLTTAHSEQSWCMSPLLNIKAETRFIIFRNAVIFAFEKRDPVTIHGVRMHNLRLGARAHTVVPDKKLELMAIDAARVLQMEFVAVDIVTTDSNEHVVLEVNDGFSLEHYMRQSEANRVRATGAYRTIFGAMFN